MLKRKRSERSDTLEYHHVKNPYRQKKPNFAELKQLYPELLGSYVQIHSSTGNGYIDFTNTNANRALTKALLQHDFCINVTIPEDNLCPPLPNRINYLCWLSDLIDSLCTSEMSIPSNESTILDIGVGPVGIYPILGNKLFNWKFVATDIDRNSVQHCQQNIDANPPLSQDISIYHVEDSTVLQQDIISNYLPLLSQSGLSCRSMLSSAPSLTTAVAALRGPVRQALWAMGRPYQALCQLCALTCIKEMGCENINNNTNSSSSVISNQTPVFTATMCNPPFYDLEEQILPAEHTVCTGSTSEMRTIGGEVSFICAIIADSLVLRDKIVWYTSMVGKQSSLRVLLRILQQEGVPRKHIFTTTLRQGLTHRWCLAWTFSVTAARQYATVLPNLPGQQNTACTSSQSDYTHNCSSTSSAVQQQIHVFELTTTLSMLQTSEIASDREQLARILPVVSPSDQAVLLSEAALSLLLCRVLAAVRDTFSVSMPSPDTTTATSSTTTTTTNATTDSVEVGAESDAQVQCTSAAVVTLFLRSVHCPSTDSVTLLYSCHTTSTSAAQSSADGCTVEMTVSMRSAPRLAESISINAESSDSGTASLADQQVCRVGVYISTPSAAPTQHSVCSSREYWRKQQDQLTANFQRTNRRWRRILEKQKKGLV